MVTEPSKLGSDTNILRCMLCVLGELRNTCLILWRIIVSYRELGGVGGVRIVGDLALYEVVFHLIAFCSVTSVLGMIHTV